MVSEGEVIVFRIKNAFAETISKYRNCDTTTVHTWLGKRVLVEFGCGLNREDGESFWGVENEILEMKFSVKYVALGESESFIEIVTLSLFVFWTQNTYGNIYSQFIILPVILLRMLGFLHMAWMNLVLHAIFVS